MNYDEFAFFNQQLAGMLKSGIPLEGALHQLSSTMRRGRLRDELSNLEADLSQGIPLEKALFARKLPPTYIAMLRAGVRSNDLPGTLTLVADHYQRLSLVFTRLKGLMVYPAIVLGAAFGLSMFLTYLNGTIASGMWDVFSGIGMPLRWNIHTIGLLIWLPPVTIALLGTCFAIVIGSGRLRRKLQWRIPAFRDAYIAQLASTGEIMLRRGHTFPDTLQFLAELERDTPAEKALLLWKSALADGRDEMPISGQIVFPPLFVWLLKSAGENLADGFRRAAEIYQRRASQRFDLLLFAALPITVIVLGTMLVFQVYPSLLQILNMFTLMDSGL